MLFETILCIDGAIQNIDMHEKRMEKSSGKKFSLSFLSPPKNGVFRCKVLYDSEIVSVEFAPYIKRPIKTLKVVFSDISYQVKSTDRDGLNELFLKKGGADDVLIVKNNLVTDTTITNVAFLLNDKWITPKHPLLEGTMRERLLNSGFLVKRDIQISDINHFEKIAIMNALRGFEPLGSIKEVVRF